jgi:hypothetical protein
MYRPAALTSAPHFNLRRHWMPFRIDHVTIVTNVTGTVHIDD